jgi:myo-inositol-1-phosphate synthase
LTVRTSRKGKNKKDLANQLIADIRKFKADNTCDRLVLVWVGSTEVYMTEAPCHQSLAAFEKGLEASDPAISSSLIYAYAAISEGLPYANAAPNLSAEIPALQELAQKTGSPIVGNDMKTGQTLIKTIIAPGLKARLLGVHGWYSTNILGNRDGEVLDDPESFKTKEESKKGALDYIFQPHLYPDLYKDLSHVVRINYYPPRGDNKEGWDNIDIFGWLGYKMQLKINFLCRDSILAAPIVADVALFLDLAQRSGMSGIQEWLSFYFKSPMYAKGLYPEHDLFIQLMKLKNTLRHLKVRSSSHISVANTTTRDSGEDGPWGSINRHCSGEYSSGSCPRCRTSTRRTAVACGLFGGGVLVVYLQQQASPTPVATGDAVIGGPDCRRARRRDCHCRERAAHEGHRAPISSRCAVSPSRCRPKSWPGWNACSAVSASG